MKPLVEGPFPRLVAAAVSEEMYRAVQLLVARDDVSMAYVVRHALREYLLEMGTLRFAEDGHVFREQAVSEEKL